MNNTKFRAATQRLAIAVVAATPACSSSPAAFTTPAPNAALPPSATTAGPCEANLAGGSVQANKGPGSLPSDIIADYDINTRTGCFFTNVALGSVSGAEDLQLPVSLSRNEGQAPPSTLYANAIYGNLGWLSSDEFVDLYSIKNSKVGISGGAVYWLHAPKGVAQYDTLMSLRDPAQLGSEPAYHCTIWLRERPFDNSFLCVVQPIPGATVPNVIIYYGNPEDTRSVRKEFYASAGQNVFLLGAVAKASIYKGVRNEIRITRKPAVPGSSSTPDPTTGVIQETIFTSSLYDSGWDPSVSGKACGTKATPPALPAPLPAQTCTALDIKATAQKITATQMLTTCASPRVTTVALDDDYNISSVTAPGRVGTESHVTMLGYQRANAEQWLLNSSSESEGSGGSMRVFEQAEFARQPGTAGKPWSVGQITDTTEPGAQKIHQVTACPPRLPSGGLTPQQYLTFNYANGTSAAYEYTTPALGYFAIGRMVDTNNLQIQTIYQMSQEANSTVIHVSPDTMYEVQGILLSSNNQNVEGSTMLFERASIDTFHIPLVYKVLSGFNPATSSEVPRGVFRQAVYSNAPALGGVTPTGVTSQNTFFDKPWVYSDRDGHVHQDKYTWDGFLSQHTDTVGSAPVSTIYGFDSGFTSSYNSVRADTTAGGSAGADYCTETLYKGIAIGTTTAVVEKEIKDRFGHVTSRTRWDSQGESSPTTTYQFTAQGYAKTVTSPTGDVLSVTVNPTLTAMTESTVKSAGGTVLASASMTVDDYGNANGSGTRTDGVVQYQLTATRGTAGVLSLLSKTVSGGGAATTNTYQAEFSNTELAPAMQSVNGRPTHSSTPSPDSADGGCK